MSILVGNSYLDLAKLWELVMNIVLLRLLVNTRHEQNPPLNKTISEIKALIFSDIED